MNKNKIYAQENYYSYYNVYLKLPKKNKHKYNHKNAIHALV